MKDFMIYKGYIGSVRYSDEDEVFYGKLEGIRDLVTFEGQNVKDIKKAFHEAVDDYLEDCRLSGDKPDKPFKGSFNVRIGSELHKRAMMEATKKGISLNQLVQRAIEKEVTV